MSKNFELMQRLESERPLTSDLGTSTTTYASQYKDTRLALGKQARDTTRHLVQKLYLVNTQQPPQAVVFAGVDQDNGCSQICAAVAETLVSETSKTVCVVEAHVQSPSLAGLFGVSPKRGFIDALLKNEPILDFTDPLIYGKLWLLSSGKAGTEGFSSLPTDRLRERIGELRKEFDYLIIDSPPLSLYSDTLVLGQLSDGVVVVIEADSTRRKVALEVTENLRSSGVAVLAAVLNNRTLPIPKNIYDRL